MKALIISLTIMGLVISAFAVDKAELDQRIYRLQQEFAAMQQKPDKAIPPNILRDAQGIILLDRAKGGFLFAYEGGEGVAMVKDPKTKQWSPTAFVNASDASLGFQVGGDGSFQVIVLMNRDALKMLTDPKVAVSSEAQGTAATSSATASSALTPEQATLVYDDRVGLFAGASLKCSSISPDSKANRVYYGKFVSMDEILLEPNVEPSQRASELATTLSSYYSATATAKK